MSAIIQSHVSGVLWVASDSRNDPSTISTSSSVPPSVFDLGISPDRVLFVDPARALSSICALRSNPSDARHIQRYSDNGLGSGLSALQRQLQTIPTSTQKGDALLSTAIGVLHISLDSAKEELCEASSLVRTLRSETTHGKEDVRRAVFGPAQEPVVLNDHTPSWQLPSGTTKASKTTASDNGNKVQAAMARASEAVLPVLDNLTWWRVLWAPDEVGWRMRQAIPTRHSGEV